ncbi:hypothetical protein AGLY_008569 [Aphis glycines]|uniref:Uncharacterized protein n=1 Tax=Aphis glycines TaxID=307491 RepID=A0A6G0TMM4_APHGL|nr:hypothetical protein AGLY_008569 [Aphis glycines]
MSSSSINEENKKCICAYDKLQLLQTDLTNYEMYVIPFNKISTNYKCSYWELSINNFTTVHSHLLSVHSHLLSVHSHLLSVLSHLLSVHSHLLSVHSHLLSVLRHLLSVLSHLLSVHSHLLSVHSHLLSVHSHLLSVRSLKYILVNNVINYVNTFTLLLCYLGTVVRIWVYVSWLEVFWILLTNNHILSPLGELNYCDDL